MDIHPHEEGDAMRTTDGLSRIEHPLIRQTLAALMMAGTLLAIPTPVAADTASQGSKACPADHSASQAIQGASET